MTEPEKPWPLDPVPVEPPAPAEEDGAVRDVLATFAKGVIGGGLTLFGVGAILIPNLIEARGATRTWVLEKARRERCMELGLTLEQLEALERGEKRE